MALASVHWRSGKKNQSVLQALSGPLHSKVLTINKWFLHCQQTMSAAMTIIIHDKTAIVLMVWLLPKFCVLSLEMSEFFLLCFVQIFSTVVNNTLTFPNHHTSITPPLLTLQIQIQSCICKFQYNYRPPNFYISHHLKT